MKAKTKQPKQSTQIKKIAAALTGIEEDRQLSDEIVEDALKEALKKALVKNMGIDVNGKVEIENGKIHVYQVRDVVENVEDDELEISLQDARKTNPLIQLGDTVDEEVDFTTFDRAAVVLAKNVMKQKIREAEKQQVYEEYCDKVDEMVYGTVETVEEKFMIVNIGKTFAMMKKAAQIPTETYHEGDRIQVIITEVNKETKGAQVLVSRSTPVFVKRLFEREVPEIYNGIIEIKAIAREPGERCKIAVLSHNPNIDAIGSCIGPRGSRVQNIIQELNGEKIDIFEWSDNIQQLVANALSPAEGVVVIPNDKVKDGLIVVVPDNQLSLAIGRKGKNARLAVKLSNHKIDIKSQSEMKEAGIDYEALAKQMEDEYKEKKAQELAYKQARKAQDFQENAGPIEDISVADFDFADEEEVPELPANETLFEKENLLPENEEQAIAQADAAEELPAVVEPAAEEEKPLDEMELAAKIAKEKRKEKPLETHTEYTSKFESMAGTAKAENTPAKKKKEEPKPEAKPKPKKKPTFAAMKPIYTDEELAEIEEQEEAEEYEKWDDDVDYEDYDSYYDN